MPTFVTILFDLLATAVLYGAAPLLLLRFRRSPLTKRTLKVYHISYTVLISFLFAIIQSLGGAKHSFAPALLWGMLYYNYNVSRFTRKGLLISKEDARVRHEKEVEVPPLPAVEEEPAPPASDKKAHIVKVRRRIEGTVPLSVPVETVSSPVETIPVPVEEPEQAAPTKNNRRVKWAVIALSALCLVSIAGNVYQAYTANALSDKNDALATELEKKERSLSQKTARAGLYEDKYNELKKEYDSKSWSLFIAETQIGYVLDGDEYLYHNINCPIVQVELEYGTLYGIHNIEFCEWLGYVKCPLCWQETSQKS